MPEINSMLVETLACRQRVCLNLLHGQLFDIVCTLPRGPGRDEGLAHPVSQ